MEHSFECCVCLESEERAHFVLLSNESNSNSRVETILLHNERKDNSTVVSELSLWTQSSEHDY